MDLKIISKIILIGYYFAHYSASPINVNNGWTLRVIHTNDMHARFEQISAFSTRCLPKAAEAGKCYGGFARLATLVRQARNSTTPTIFLNAGDTFQGTLWFTVHKWKIVAKFLNLLNPNAISLGNHELDKGPENLIPFINAAEFPIVAANLDLTNEPELAATKLNKSVILDIDGHKIGVIGYLTPDTKVIAKSGKVGILDEIPCIKEEVKNLQAKGVNILIALGHSGFEMDQKIAAEVEGLDLVIGGHTNTFLYTGEKPDLEIPEGLYPTTVIQKSGRKVYVVQAYAYTKYLGNLTIDFNGEGEIENIHGNPVLLDNSIPQAEDILDELQIWKNDMNNFSKSVVGRTKVFLDGSDKHCRAGECNMGNLIVDAMIDYNVREYAGTNGWTDAAIAMHNGGTIRSSIVKSSDGEITRADVLEVLPFNNGMVKLEINGTLILQTLEHSVYNLNINDTSNLDGRFLHFSGLQVVYDLSQSRGSRVISVLIRCADCEIPIYENLNKTKNYKVLTINFLQRGGDGFHMLSQLPWTTIGVTTDDIVIDYISRHSPVYTGVDGRIKFI